MTDLIEDLLGLHAGSPLSRLRAERAAIRDHAQGAFRELVTPAAPGGVSLAERRRLAVLVSELDGDPALARFYAALPAGHAEGSRGSLLDRYARMVAEHPETVTQGDIDALSAAGLSPQDIVAVTQLVAFVPYQVRLLAGLRAMGGQPGTELPPPRAADRPFTAAEVGWTPRIPPVVAETATPAQLAALDACPPAQRRSTYFLTLAQDPASLGERGALFNSVMYAPRGLPRVERELATAAVSMVNGCVYCCSVHLRRFGELSRDAEAVQSLQRLRFDAPLEPRRLAIVRFSAKLTATPAALGSDDLVPLRDAGLAELELLDLVHAVAMFANANRLMQALGESVLPAG